MISTVSLGHKCGYCAEWIEKGAPVALLANGRQIRCSTCADNLGFPVDMDAYNAAVKRMQADAIEHAQRTEDYEARTRRDAPVEPLRIRPAEQIEMGFDYGKAAANDRDEVNS